MIDPLKATVGVGLGLAGHKPGVGATEGVGIAGHRPGVYTDYEGVGMRDTGGTSKMQARVKCHYRGWG